MFACERYFCNFLWCTVLLPETLDPESAKGHSIKQYCASGDVKQDLNLFKNLKAVLSDSKVLNAFLTFWLLENLMGGKASITADYLRFRWGMDSIWLILIFIVGGPD